MGVRIHTKDSRALMEYLRRNGRDFQTESTSSGFPTYNVSGKSVYVRDKVINRAGLNKILAFHNSVAQSRLYKFINKFSVEEIKEESAVLEGSLIYKGFTFKPGKKESFEKVIKIDFNSAYWQSCKYFQIINKMMYDDVDLNCTKVTRLRITGTLGKKNTITDYVKGRKTKAYIKEENKRRVVFQNIYNRIRKFVDELMIWCYKRNPENFIGYYVDCVWLYEYDEYIVDKLRNIFNLKIEVVDLEVSRNNHGKVYLYETNEDKIDITPYDAQFKSNEFVIYKNLYNFTPDLIGINLKVK
jgi:hypothetical protein